MSCRFNLETFMAGGTNGKNEKSDLEKFKKMLEMKLAGKKAKENFRVIESF